LEHPGPLRAELRRIAVGVPEEECGRSVRERSRRRQLGVEVLEPPPGELVAEQRVRGAADPQRMPRTQDVVVIARLRELLRPHAAAKAVGALEHAYTPPGPREQRAARERVDAAADDDGVVLSHAPSPDRRHLPTPPARDRRSTRRTSSDDRRDPPPCTASRRTG